MSGSSTNYFTALKMPQLVNAFLDRSEEIVSLIIKWMIGILIENLEVLKLINLHGVKVFLSIFNVI